MADIRHRLARDRDEPGPQKEIDAKSPLPGESGQAAEAIDGAFPDESSEQVLIQSKQLKANDPQFAHPDFRVEEMGDESLTKATADKSNKEMGASMMASLPLTLIILVFAFGALVAAAFRCCSRLCSSAPGRI